MKKYFALLSCALMALTACEKNALEESTVMNPVNADPQEVVLTFSPYEQEAMTRAGVECSSVLPTRSATRAGGDPTSIATIATRLDVWLYQDGQEVQAIHQTSADADFGTVALTLDKRKTYTLYACAHKDTGAATLQDGIITWPGAKMTHSMFYTQTFTPAETTTLSCLMQRIVAQFRLETTDAVPSEADRITITVDAAPAAWNVSGYGMNPRDYTATYQGYNLNQDGSVTLSAFVIADPDESVLHTVTVTAYDTAGQPLQQRTFDDVPLCNGYRTTYRGAFFTDTAFTSTFTVSDWQEFDTVEF